MDKILYGVIKSNHPTAVKKAVVSRISTAAATNTDEEICINIIKTSLDILVQPNSSKDEINLVSIVFKNWMKHHMDVAFQYLNKEILQKSSSKLKCEEKTLKLKTLRCCIKTVSTFYDISKSPIKDMLKKYLFSTLTQCESLECLSLCCEFLLENHFFLPEQMEFETKIEITKTIITVISNSPYIFQNTAGADLSPTEKHLKVVSDFFSVCIHHNEKLMRHAAGYLFKLLSSKDKHPSISLVCILPSLKLNVLETDMEGLMMTAVSNEPLTATLGHMVDWICFPNDTLPVDDWVINFMKYLIKYRKFECLFSVVDSKIKQICNMMFFPVMRKGAVSVLTFMLISYLHSPEPFHQICVEKCTSFRNKEKVILSWQLQGLLWNHKSDCEYGCMMNVTKERIKFNQPVLQYFGKWPLTRFFGIQEPASALFSFLHCIAQIFGWLQYQKFVNKNYEFYSLTKMQFNVNMIGWICATVFHTRDFYWTEKFDYFSAAGIIAISIYTCFARIAGKMSDTKVYLLGIVLLIIFSHHIYHMAFVHFDYGYNAKFLMGVGAINISIWLIWCAKNWTERPYVWKCALTMGGTLVFATLEIVDFTPIWFILDGHSLWHMFTIPLSYMWYQFLIADALFETKKIAKLP